MKKLVLVMVFVLMIALFIAFNYLLWDRESKTDDIKRLENTNSSFSSNINAQNRDIKRLENDNNQILNDIIKLEKEKEQTSQKNQQLESEKTANAQITEHKIDLINILKQNVDIKLFEAPIKIWVDAVDAGDYKEAYQLEFKRVELQTKQVSLEDYSNNLRNNVKSIRISEISLDPDAGKAEGEIWLAVTLEVKVKENAEQDSARFAAGPNKMNFILDYDVSLNEFFISEIKK